MSDQQWIISVIFVLSYLGLALGSIPKLHIERTEIAFIGATAMLLFTPLTWQQAECAIDFQVLALLFAMMVLVAYLEIRGFFHLCVVLFNKFCLHPITLLVTIIMVAGILSAFLINDIVCFALTPLIITICKQRNISVLPFLFAIGMAANIGSVATVTGNPQNILIAHFAHLSYGYFFFHLAPIAILGLIITVLLLLYFFRHDFFVKKNSMTKINETMRVANRFSLYWTVLVLLAVIVLFFLHFSMALVALAAAAILFIGRIPPQKVYALIDWQLLLLFIALFVLFAGVQYYMLPVIPLHWFQQHNSMIFSLLIVLLSNLVSNVPAALLLKPIVLHSHQVSHQALLLAAISTLAGNLTLLGSIANLIVVRQAKKQGISISYWQFFKLGLPITILTVVIAYKYLSL